MRIDTDTLAVRSREELLRRSAIFETFFKAEAPRLAETCYEISRRFLAGGLHHPARPGTVTVSGKPGVDVPSGTLNSILKQAGLK